MDFEDTPEEAAFRHEVKTWLAEQAADYDMATSVPSDSWRSDASFRR